MKKFVPQSAGAARPRPRIKAGARGFTLLEILLVLAIMGLLSGILISGATRLLNPGPETPRQAFWTASGAARRYALLHETQVRLSFDATAEELVASPDTGDDLPPVKLPGGGGIVFIEGLAPTTLAGTPGVFSDITGEGNDSTISSVIFYPDGTCTAFRAEVSSAMAVGTSAASSIIAVDPWTGGPMLAAVEPNGAETNTSGFAAP